MKISTEEALEIIEEIQEEHELEAIAVLYEMDLIGNERMSYYYDDESMIFSMLEDKGAHYLVRLFVCVSEDAFVDSKIQGVGGGYLLMSREED